MIVEDLLKSEGVEVGLYVSVPSLLRQERAVAYEVVWVTHVVTALASMRFRWV